MDVTNVSLAEAARDPEMEQEVSRTLEQLYRIFLIALDPGDPHPPVVRREKEMQKIDDFVRGAVTGAPSSAMLYISGVPGTGKTTVVRSVISNYTDNEEYDFELCEINGMELVQPIETFLRIWRAMKEACSAECLRALQKQDFPNSSEGALESIRMVLEMQSHYEMQSGRGQATACTVAPLSHPLLVVLDEMDIAIGTVGSTVLFDLVDLLLKTNMFCFIGIANRQNLFETFRFDEGHTMKIQSRTEKLARLIFPNYSGMDLEEIIFARVNKIEAEVTTRLQRKRLHLVGNDVISDQFVRLASVTAHKLAGGDCRSALLLIMHVVSEKLKYLEAKLGYECTAQQLQHTIEHGDYKLSPQDVQASKVQALGRSQKHLLSDLELLVLSLIAYQLSRSEGNSIQANKQVRIEVISQRYQIARARLVQKDAPFGTLSSAASGAAIAALTKTHLVSGTVCIAALDDVGSEDEEEESEDSEDVLVCSEHAGGIGVFQQGGLTMDLVNECGNVLNSLQRLGYVAVKGPHVSMLKLTTTHELGPVLLARPHLLKLSFLKDLPVNEDLL